jgi:hypothetical protein
MSVLERFLVELEEINPMRHFVLTPVYSNGYNNKIFPVVEWEGRVKEEPLVHRKLGSSRFACIDIRGCLSHQRALFNECNTGMITFSLI